MSIHFKYCNIIKHIYIIYCWKGHIFILILKSKWTQLDSHLIWASAHSWWRRTQIMQLCSHSHKAKSSSHAFRPLNSHIDLFPPLSLVASGAADWRAASLIMHVLNRMSPRASVGHWRNKLTADNALLTECVRDRETKSDSASSQGKAW